MLHARVNGSAQLRKVAAQIRTEGDKGLGREMADALRRTAQPVQKSIAEAFAASLPARGGYREVASKSIRFRTALRSGARTGSFRITTFAEGTKERRDIRRLDKGELRHPVFGRSRRIRRGVKAGTALPNPWATTKIPAHFHQRGTELAADAAEREMSVVLDQFADRLMKG